MQNYGMLLLAIYLVLTGVDSMFGLGFVPFHNMILGVLAVVTGVLVFMKK
jgi:hypothetical protein